MYICASSSYIIISSNFGFPLISHAMDDVLSADWAKTSVFANKFRIVHFFVLPFKGTANKCISSHSIARKGSYGVYELLL